MKYRKLRIAWLAVWLAFAVLAYMRMQIQLVGVRIVPDWLLATLCVLIAATPMLAWPKQFSLRTLLIAMTLVAVGLGLAVYANRN